MDRDAGAFDELSRVNNEFANLQREMAKKNVELAKLNDVKNRVLGVAAHDLRTPLAVIRSYAEFLEADARDELTPQHREFVSTIKDTSEFMLRLVSDLLDVTTIEAGRLQLDRQATDLEALIRRNVGVNAILAARKDIPVVLDPVPPLPHVVLDGGKIEQVLNNLIGNAVKFSHRGRAVRVGVSLADGFVTVAVQDQGQGIPDAEMSRLFKPYGTTSVRTTGGEQSTGLGLAIVRNIVEGHGGRISVTSAVGQGSTFAFTLPLPAGDGTASLPAVASSARILVADDNVVNQKIALIQLKKLGLTGDVASTGREAVDAVARHGYDLVLMDCHMPDMDGLEATRAIRRTEVEGRRTIIVAMTASMLEADRQTCVAAGMDDYLTKPSSIDSLGQLLTRWLKPPTP